MCSKHFWLECICCVSACACLTFNAGQTLTSSPQRLPQQFHPSCFPIRRPSPASYHHSRELQMGGKRDLYQILTFCSYGWKEVKRPPHAEKKRAHTVPWLHSMQSLKATVLGSVLRLISFTSAQALQQDYRRQIFLFLALTFSSKKNDFPGSNK